MNILHCFSLICLQLKGMSVFAILNKFLAQPVWGNLSPVSPVWQGRAVGTEVWKLSCILQIATGL